MGASTGFCQLPPCGDDMKLFMQVGVLAYLAIQAENLVDSRGSALVVLERVLNS